MKTPPVKTPPVSTPEKSEGHETNAVEEEPDRVTGECEEEEKDFEDDATVEEVD